MIEIQKRDVEILRICHEQQFLTREHFRTFFNTHQSAADRRLRKLIQADFIQIEFHPQWGREPILRLTRNGYYLAKKNHTLPEMGYPKLNLSCLIHDALVTSVRLRLSQFWSAHFVPERAIKNQQSAFEIPDGIFYFPSGRGIAIEIENSNKGKFRLLKLLDRWKAQPQIAAVLYVASTQELFRTVLNAIQEAPLLPETLVGVVEWTALQKGIPPVTTKIGNADLFSKREVF
jgi:DNA-binding MarR family transcriptional regulator